MKGAPCSIAAGTVGRPAGPAPGRAALELELAALAPPRLVCRGERGVDADPHALAERRRRPGKRGRLAERDLVGRNAVLGARRCGGREHCDERDAIYVEQAMAHDVFSSSPHGVATAGPAIWLTLNFKPRVWPLWNTWHVC